MKLTFTLTLALAVFFVMLTKPTASETVLAIPAKNSAQIVKKSNKPVMRGIASWYGMPFHERLAASGEIYDMYELTAAHLTLPFNTIVRVTNLTNHKQVDVRITDRGPYVDGRVIDLSLAAAQELDMVETGVARVKMEVISRGEKYGSATR